MNRVTDLHIVDNTAETSHHYPALTRRLLDLSVSDDYEEAKKEWRITGRVWRKTMYGTQIHILDFIE